MEGRRATFVSQTPAVLSGVAFGLATACGGLMALGLYLGRKKVEDLEKQSRQTKSVIDTLKGIITEFQNKATLVTHTRCAWHESMNLFTQLLYKGTMPKSNFDEISLVWRLVLTGGPCAGTKFGVNCFFATPATLVVCFHQQMPHLSWQTYGNIAIDVTSCIRPQYFVATVSEAATFLHNNGVSFYPKSPDMFQNYCQEMAVRENIQAVMLFDRGIQDGRSYYDEKGWQTVLGKIGFPTDIDMIMKRYDAVFHLVTAADGAQKFYTKTGEDGKQVRHEEPDQAKDLDRKLQKAWSSHPKHYVFKNNGTFEDKLEKMISQMCKLLGVPHTKKKPRKFLLKSMPRSFPAVGLDNMSTATFTKTYIKPPEQKNMKNVQKHDPQPFMFVRERTQQAIGDATEKRSLNIRSYILKTVSTKGAQEIESTRNLSRREVGLESH
eukprot:jgi/Bigna1/75828/fgenesh1_pg.37_\